jgi:drug/metabolite transporter (DMT)-like permease
MLLIGITVFHEVINRYDILGIAFVFTGLALVFLKGH